MKQELYGWLESHPVHAFIKAKIDYTEGNNEALLHYVTKRLRAFDYSSLSTYERYLNKHYPLEMIAHYKRIVESLLAERKRSAYRRAIGFMKEIEHVYTNILKEPNKWSFYFKSFIADVLEIPYHKSTLLKEFKVINKTIKNLQPKGLMIRDFQ